MLSRGQSLMEVVVVMAVVIIVVSALVFATIASLRNAQFSRQQLQAAKLAQEAIEKVRSIRDRADAIDGNFTLGSADGADGDNVVSSFSDEDMWDISISANCIPSCYFKINPSGRLQYIGTTLSGAELIPPSPAATQFSRVVELADSSLSYQVEKTIIVKVFWTDFSGEHESRLTTILRKL